MNKMILAFLIVLGNLTLLNGQDIRLRKGVVLDSISINDSIPESFALYLPKSFDTSRSWPVLFVMDLQGKGKQVAHMFREVAEQEGYILAASNALQDSLSIVQNSLIVSRMFNAVYKLFPIHKSRTYTAGFGTSAKFAAVIPSVIKPVEGTISIGAGIPYIELLDPKNPFQFIGIVGRSDHNFNTLIADQHSTSAVKRLMNKNNIPHYLLVYEGGHEWPESNYLQRAVEIFTMRSMEKGNIPRDTSYLRMIYNRDLSTVNRMASGGDMLGAKFLLDEMLLKFKGLQDLDELKKRNRSISRDKRYLQLQKKQDRIFQKEYFIKGDYRYNLNDDVLSLNYNNLGWWNYQMEEIKKFISSSDVFEKEKGMRLHGYLNALIEENIELELAQNPINEEALSYLWMVKTITSPKEYENYLNIISDSAKYEDFGTALFYLEELLKQGYEDKAALYSLKHTALLRIMPEFNELIDKYLKDARYDIIDE